jgi:hypothetical protein
MKDESKIGMPHMVSLRKRKNNIGKEYWLLRTISILPQP